MTKMRSLTPDKVPQLNELGEYLEFTSENLKNSAVPLVLEAADNALSLLIKNASEPGNFRVIGLINYAYSNWRSTIVLALTGNTHQVPIIARTSLEAVLYAHLFSKDKNWLDCWERRLSSKKDADKFRKEGPAAARLALKKVNPSLVEEVKSSTDFFVEFGGHPNIGAIENFSSYFQNSANNDEVFVIFSQLEDLEKRSESVLYIAQLALTMLKVLTVIWPERAVVLNLESNVERIRNLAVLFLQGHRRRFGDNLGVKG